MYPDEALNISSLAISALSTPKQRSQPFSSRSLRSRKRRSGSCRVSA
jgi:hypothetical protein